MAKPGQLEKFFKAGDLDGARRAVKKLLGQDPTDPTALIGKARLLALDGAHAQALDILNPLIEQQPDLVAARTYKAVVMDLMGKQQTAEVLLKAASRLEPQFAPARYNLARHLVRAGKQQEALGELEAAAEADPENPTYHLRIAEVLLELGNQEQAGEVLTALVSTFPGFSHGWLLAARAYMSRGDARGAIRVIAASVEHCPTDVSLAIAAFQAAAALGDFALCAQSIEVVSQLDDAFAGELEKVLAVVKVKREDDLDPALRAIHTAQAEEIAYFLETVLGASSNKKRAANLRLAIRKLRRRVRDAREGPKKPSGR